MSEAARSGTGGPRRRFLLMFRARPGSLALTSAGLAIAAILGVQLGRSAISEINPIHFQGALERPQAITPPPEPAPYDPYAQASYPWSMSPPPLMTAGCEGDCDGRHADRAMRLALDDAAGRDPNLPYWRDATPPTQLRPWAPGAVPGGLPLERYMTYPVNREQAERAAAAAQPTPVPAPVPAQADAQVTAAPAPAEALRPTPAVAEAPVEE